LLGRHCTTWATPPTLFCDELFEVGSSVLFFWGWLQLQSSLLCLLKS
jgi:hypothetical protein